MSDTDMIQEEYRNELTEAQRHAGKFSNPLEYWTDAQLEADEQATERAGDHTDSNNAHMKRLLYWMARERAKSHRWNTNALMLSYSILITVVVLTLSGINALIVGLVAVLGLVILWLFSWLQSRKMEKQFYQQEMQQYVELLSSEVMNNSNGVETPSHIDTVESPLTQRELEVMSQVVKGKINKEIGSALGIREETIKNHLAHIFTKLDVNDRTSAVVMALHHGWINYDHLK